MHKGMCGISAMRGVQYLFGDAGLCDCMALCSRALKGLCLGAVGTKVALIVDEHAIQGAGGELEEVRVVGDGRGVEHWSK